MSTPRPRILDLFCGAGGSAMGYHQAGFDVVGVDVKPQPRYPFEFVQADATTFPLDGFDVIHASPPCQGYLNLTKQNAAMGRQVAHPDLIAIVRERLLAAGVPYLIENVTDARPQLRGPVQMCGTAFGLPLRRHRLFETNILAVQGVACRHRRFTQPRFWTSWRPDGEHRLATTVQVYGNGGDREQWGEAMGIDWMGPAELVEAIPPAYTQFIGEQLLEHLASERVA